MAEPRQARDERAALPRHRVVRPRPVDAPAAVVAVPPDGVGARVGDLLPVVEHRHAVEEEARRNHRRVPHGPVQRLLALLARVHVREVVVLEATHPVEATRVVAHLRAPRRLQEARRGLPGEQVDHRPLRVEAVGEVERGDLVVALQALAEEEDARLRGAAAARALLPEVDGQHVGHVAAEAVHVVVADEGEHVRVEVFAHGGVRDVHLRERPVAELRRAARVAHDVVGVVLQEDGVGTAVEVDEVEHHLHAEAVRLGDERPEVGLRAVFGIDGEEVLLAVGVLRVLEAAGLLATAPEARVGVVVRELVGRQVDEVDAERLQVRQLRARGGEGPLRREHAREELVHDARAEEVRHGARRRRLRRVGARVGGVEAAGGRLVAVGEAHERERARRRDEPAAGGQHEAPRDGVERRARPGEAGRRAGGNRERARLVRHVHGRRPRRPVRERTAEGVDVVRERRLKPLGRRVVEGGVFVAEADERRDERAAVFARRGPRRRPVDAPLAEEAVRPDGMRRRVGDLLPVVEHRHAVEREDRRKEAVVEIEAVLLLPTRFARRAVRVVVVLEAAHPAVARRVAALARAAGRREVRRRAAPPQHVADRLLHGEGVVEVEGERLVVMRAALAEHHDVRLHRRVPPVRLLTEGARQHVAHVAAEPVAAELREVPLHVLVEVFAHGGMVEVEAGERPFAELEGAVRVAQHPVGLVLQEDGVGPAVVVDDVEEHLHAEAVRGRDEVLQVLLRAVFGIDAEVVGDAVGVAGVSEAAPLLAPAPERGIGAAVRRRDRTEVEDFHAQGLHEREARLGGLERPLRREHAEEELVHRRPLEEGGGRTHRRPLLRDGRQAARALRHVPRGGEGPRTGQALGVRTHRDRERADVVARAGERVATRSVHTARGRQARGGGGRGGQRHLHRDRRAAQVEDARERAPVRVRPQERRHLVRPVMRKPREVSRAERRLLPPERGACGQDLRAARGERLARREARHAVEAEREGNGRGVPVRARA